MKNINNLQLRAARQVLNYGVRDIANLLKISKASVSKAELGKTRDFFFKHSAPLLDFFCSQEMVFPSEYAVRFKYNAPNCYSSNKEEYMTRFQLKGARSIINISQHQLAIAINIDKSVISRAELIENHRLINPLNPKVISSLKNFFLAQGIEFPDPFSIFFKKYIDKVSS
jgi:transcriptional regulator with XRE-family HTH domain